MPGVAVSEIREEGEVIEEVHLPMDKQIPGVENAALSLGSQDPQNGETKDNNVEGPAEPSIEQLYKNVCEMHSSDQSPSRPSFGSYGEESQIDSELRHLVGGEMREAEKPQDDADSCLRNGNSSFPQPSGDVAANQLPTELVSSPQPFSNNRNGVKSSKKGPPVGASLKRYRNSPLLGSKSKNEVDDPSLGNPDIGHYLLKQARDLMSSRDNPRKALDFAQRAAISFEKCSGAKKNLDVVMCLHVIAAIHCAVGQYGDAIPVLQRSIEIPVAEEGQDHALAKFSGYMQLGDTYAMLGQLEKSIDSYKAGLDVQRAILGDGDMRVAETCRYLAETYVQAMQFDEAQKLCQIAIDIHRDNGSPSSLEEAADRRLMGLIYESKGDHEAALEQLVLASMAMVANGQEAEVASVDCSIGDTYLSLNRYDEAVFAYQKALTSLKASKGENHPSVASVLVRLAELYNKTGKFRDSRSYCENALRIYEHPVPGVAPEEIASGLTDLSALYEAMDELEQALKLLQKALKIYDDAPGQQSTIAGIEAQMGVIHYMFGNYSESYTSFKSATDKLRKSGEKKSSFFGITLNQMGLACVQQYAFDEALELFEEARTILEHESGPYHPDTIGVYSNLAATYDAVGRLEDAIGVLEFIVGMREEKLGTANPDVDDEKKRLVELLKEAGRSRNRKNRSLENLLVSNQIVSTQAN